MEKNIYCNINFCIMLMCKLNAFLYFINCKICCICS